jgi:cytochrome b subunit of formate dehydrogenase
MVKTEPQAKVVVQRQALWTIVTHWVHVVLIATFITTGLSMYYGWSLFEPNTLTIHITCAFLIAFVDFPVHFFVMWREKELRYLAIIKKQDLVDVWQQVLNFVGLTKSYPEHATYLPLKSEYYLGKKYCAFQKLLFYSDVGCIILFGVTGFSMYYFTSFPFVGNLVGGYLNLLALHLLIFYYFTATLVGHIYLSFVPSNWGRLRAMVLGKGSLEVHTE